MAWKTFHNLINRFEKRKTVFLLSLRHIKLDLLSFLSGFVKDMSSKVMAFSVAKSTHFSVCIAYDDNTFLCRILDEPSDGFLTIQQIYKISMFHFNNSWAFVFEKSVHDEKHFFNLDWTALKVFQIFSIKLFWYFSLEQTFTEFRG